MKSFNVEYNPDGTYMTFEDGTMTAYRITMQFQELLPVTSDDYESSSFNGPLADADEAYTTTSLIPQGHIGY